MFNQWIARAFDRTRPSECPEAATHERRLPRAEVARQRDDHAARKRACKARDDQEKLKRKIFLKIIPDKKMNNEQREARWKLWCVVQFCI